MCAGASGFTGRLYGGCFLVDIDEFRESQIRMYGLTKADKSYTFYHDETNNIRKLHVGAQGLNVAELKVLQFSGTAPVIEMAPQSCCGQVKRPSAGVGEHCIKVRVVGCNDIPIAIGESQYRLELCLSPIL